MGGLFNPQFQSNRNLFNPAVLALGLGLWALKRWGALKPWFY